MKTAMLAFVLTFATLSAAAQSIYSKAFGNPKHTPVIFLHGGPGYNAAAFEATTAQKLADTGFYVVVYDRRGEGRSVEVPAAFTFEETFIDLNAICTQYSLKNPILIGHSFGGVVATLFAEKHPKLTAAVVLVGAPVVMQETFRTIISKSKDIYTVKNDVANLKYISMLENMDTKTMEYASYCFGHAMQNGFYTTPSPSKEASDIYLAFRANPLSAHASKMTFEAPQGFLKNESYTSIDLTSSLQSLKAQNFRIYGLYGKDDGLYSAEQVASLGKIIGPGNVQYLEHCSHNVFIDSQAQFINAIASLKHK
ncbi:MAG TPA: alpha/beta hydrolase [Flavobacterium sp.]|jgi:proline iminopeptidase